MVNININKKHKLNFYTQNLFWLYLQILRSMKSRKKQLSQNWENILYIVQK